MPDLPDLLAPLVGERPSAPFSLLLLIHVPAGLTCVVTGTVAMLSKKRPGRHPRFGEVYFWGLAVVFATATGMAALRWHEDAYLFYLGALSFSTGSLGYAARKVRRPGWMTFHIAGLCLSYIVLLTAFYVDNGPRLPLWNRLPPIAFWVGPSVLGLPLLARALPRHTRVPRDLRASAGALRQAMWGCRTRDKVGTNTDARRSGAG
jgi:hypothetical protein